MKFIQGIPRHQAVLFATCLDDAVEADHEVRLIDVFVDSLKLAEYGFKLDHVENGRPAYHPSTLLKLFIYGYLNPPGRTVSVLLVSWRKNVSAILR